MTPDSLVSASQSTAEEGLAGGSGGITVGTANSESGKTADSAPKYTVLQVMSTVDSDTDTLLVYDNPLKPFAGFALILALFMGALQYALWFKRESRGIEPFDSGRMATA